MTLLLTVIHILVCLVLVFAVLLQQGKKDGMGTSFSGGSQSVFGARGAETFLEKTTKILAVLFMTTSLSLVYLAGKESNSSLLSGEKTPDKAPAVESVAEPDEPATESTAEPTTEPTPASPASQP